MKVTMAACAMNVVMDKQKNLEKFLKLIDEAADHGADLIALPEQALQGYLTSVVAMDCSDTEANEFEYQYRNAECVPEGPSVQAVIEKAKERGVYVVFGMTEKDAVYDYKLYNTAVLVGPEGYIGKYHKVHQPMDELHVYYGGKTFPVFETPIGRIGLLICYDKWFPETTRELALGGADILVMSTATCFTDPVAKNYETDYAYYTFELNDRIRALENQTFFLTANQVGPFCDCYYFGHSRVVAPTGYVVADTEDKEGIAYYTTEDLQAETYTAKRKFAGMNFLRDRQPAAYKRIAEANPSCNYNPDVCES